MTAENLTELDLAQERVSGVTLGEILSGKL